MQHLICQEQNENYLHLFSRKMRLLYAANRPLTVRSQRTIHHNLAISATRASTSACVVAQLVQKRTTVPCSAAPSSSK